MIRFGPAGIPLSCKGRSLKDGIEDVHMLGLTALEVQLIRISITDRPVLDEEVGKTPREVEGELIVDVLRTPDRPKKAKTKKKATEEEPPAPATVSNFNGSLKSGDIVKILACGVAHDYKELEEYGKLAKELDVQLSVHTPYYMDLSVKSEVGNRSFEALKWGYLIAHSLGATHLVTHMGLYGQKESKDVVRNIKSRILDVSNWAKKNRLKPKLGLESSGRQEVYGSIEEIINICKKVPNTVPVLNFPHIHSRERGLLRSKDDFAKIFEKAKKLYGKQFYCHFSGVEHDGGNERRLTPIKRGDLKFEPLAECILDNGYNATLISSSPLLEHDAMYMKVILERVLTKRVSKSMKMQKGDRR